MRLGSIGTALGRFTPIMTAAGRSAFFFPKTVDASSIRAIIHYKLKLRSNEVSKVTIKEMIELIDADIEFALEVGDKEFVGYLEEAKADILEEELSQIS